MTNEMGFSLWLMPYGQVYEKLAKLISDLSRQYSAPNFQAHVTLLGDIFITEKEMLTKTSELAGGIRPFKVRLNRVDYLNDYFRCLFIRADETKELIDANSKAREIFNRQTDPKFMPHLSLMYGNFAPAMKEEIITKIGREFNTEFEVNTIILVAASSKIELKDWRILKEFVLK